MIARSFLVAGLLGLLATVASAAVEAVTCGGTQPSINSTTDLPDPLPGKQECVWFFDQGKNGSMYIYFQDFVLQPKDTFTIYNGSNAVVPIVTLSGSADPSLVVYTNHQKVQLTFKAAPEQTNATRSFQITYSHNTCNVELEQYHSAIANPIYLPQAGKMNCTYHISSSHNSSVALSFSKLNVTKGSLKVWQGENQTVAPVIDYTNPTTIVEDVISPSGKLTMELVMSAARANQTMNAGFTSGRDECTKTITVTGPMTLSSPGYPSKYTSHHHCRWILKVPKNQTDLVSIKAMFVDLDLATEYDYVVVNAGGSKSSPSLGVFMKGSPLDQVLVSGNGMMYIEMRTDDAPGGRGFHMAVMLSPYDQALFGSGHIELSPEINITTEEGGKRTRVSSAPEDDIFYQLIADEGKQVQLVFNGTGTSMSPTSVISIHDGHKPSDPQLARFRSDTPFFTVQSTGPNVLVLLTGFKRNGTMTQQKFAADFTSVEQGEINTLSDVSGVVQLNTSDATTNKTWIISTYNSPNQVALRIHGLDLDVGETLNVYNGLAPSDTKIVQLTKDVMNMPVIYAKQMRIEYVTPNKTKLSGNAASSDPVVSASYEQIAACGERQVSGASGVISSPEWPNRYPYNALCSWVFQPVQQSALHLAFTSFTLFEEHSLTITVTDYYVKNNHTVNVTTHSDRFTGENVPSDVILDMDNKLHNATSREVRVEFSSKYQGLSLSAQVASGFQMKYEYIHLDSACTGNVTNGSVISTPGFPSAVKANMSCLWIISEPPRDPKVNTTVNVIQYTLELQHVTQDNSSNRLEIHDGGSLMSTLVPVKLTDGTSGTMQSRTNQLWVKYDYTKLNTTKEGFAFRIKFNNLGCPVDKQCDNGICMQDAWKCNGEDDCGDMSDEKDCTCTAKGGKKQYSGLVLGLSIVATIILTLILAFVIPIIYRRFKYPNYSELRDLMAPVPS